MDNQNVTYNSWILDLLIKGPVFIWLYHCFNITELVSFQTLFLAIGVEVVFTLAICILAAFIAYRAAKKTEEILNAYREWDDEYDE